MTAKKKHKSPGKGSSKTFASGRTMNPSFSGSHQDAGSSTLSGSQQHDAKRRLGSFEDAGEHARTGNRGHQ
jgi:hypothetical protein